MWKLIHATTINYEYQCSVCFRRMVREPNKEGKFNTWNLPKCYHGLDEESKIEEKSSGYN